MEYAEYDTEVRFTYHSYDEAADSAQRSGDEPDHDYADDDGDSDTGIFGTITSILVGGVTDLLTDFSPHQAPPPAGRTRTSTANSNSRTPASQNQSLAHRRGGSRAHSPEPAARGRLNSAAGWDGFALPGSDAARHRPSAATAAAAKSPRAGSGGCGDDGASVMPPQQRSRPVATPIASARTRHCDGGDVAPANSLVGSPTAGGGGTSLLGAMFSGISSLGQRATDLLTQLDHDFETIFNGVLDGQEDDGEAGGADSDDDPQVRTAGPGKRQHRSSSSAGGDGGAAAAGMSGDGRQPGRPIASRRDTGARRPSSAGVAAAASASGGVAAAAAATATGNAMAAATGASSSAKTFAGALSVASVSAGGGAAGRGAPGGSAAGGGAAGGGAADRGAAKGRGRLLDKSMSSGGRRDDGWGKLGDEDDDWGWGTSTDGGGGAPGTVAAPGSGLRAAPAPPQPSSQPGALSGAASLRALGLLQPPTASTARTAPPAAVAAPPPAALRTCRSVGAGGVSGGASAGALSSPSGPRGSRGGGGKLIVIKPRSEATTAAAAAAAAAAPGAVASKASVAAGNAGGADVPRTSPPPAARGSFAGSCPSDSLPSPPGKAASSPAAAAGHQPLMRHLQEHNHHHHPQLATAEAAAPAGGLAVAQREELQLLRQQLADAHRGADAAEARCGELQLQLTGAWAQLAELRARSEATEAQGVELRQQLTAVEAEAAQLGSLVESLGNQLEASQRRCGELMTENAQLRSSAAAAASAAGHRHPHHHSNHHHHQNQQQHHHRVADADADASSPVDIGASMVAAATSPLPGLAAVLGALSRHGSRTHSRRPSNGGGVGMGSSGGGGGGGSDELVEAALVAQLTAALADKARLCRENDVLTRQLEGLQELLSYTAQYATYANSEVGGGDGEDDCIQYGMDAAAYMYDTSYWHYDDGPAAATAASLPTDAGTAAANPSAAESPSTTVEPSVSLLSSGEPQAAYGNLLYDNEEGGEAQLVGGDDVVSPAVEYDIDGGATGASVTAADNKAHCCSMALLLPLAAEEPPRGTDGASSQVGPELGPLELLAGELTPPEPEQSLTTLTAAVQRQQDCWQQSPPPQQEGLALRTRPPPPVRNLSYPDGWEVLDREGELVPPPPLPPPASARPPAARPAVPVAKLTLDGAAAAAAGPVAAAAGGAVSTPMKERTNIPGPAAAVPV